jgi:hypothetical protein
MLKKLLRNRKGTAEVIGSVLFIVIIIFFFSSVYLWHDQANREMNTLLSDKMNSPVTITCANEVLTINNTGGVDAVLSRLWITSDLNHLPVNLTDASAGSVLIKAGDSIKISLQGNSDDDITSVTIEGRQPIDFSPTTFFKNDPSLTFKVLTTLGNTAACKYS